MSIASKTTKIAAKNALGKGGNEEKETEVKPTLTKDTLKNAFPNAYAGNKFRTATKDKQSPVTMSVTGLSSAIAETNSILTTSIEVQAQQNAILTEILKAIKDGGLNNDGFDLTDLLDIGKGKSKGPRAKARAAKAAGRKGLGKSFKKPSVIKSGSRMAGRVAGKAIPGLNALLAGYEGYEEYQESGKVGRAVSVAGGSLAGGAAGAIVGQMLIPIPVVGALIGGTVGSLLGGEAGKSGYDALTGESKSEGTGKDKKYTFEGVNYKADSIGYSAKEMFIKVSKLTLKGTLTGGLGSIVNTGGAGGPGGNIPEYNGPGVAMKGSAKEAFDFFVEKGWTKEQAVGIVANLEAESNFRTNAVGDGGKAYGIAQWHPDRQANFYRAYGKDIREANFKEQLEFVNWELNNTEKRAGDLLRKATTPGHAAQIIDATYERSLAGTQGNSTGRIVSAQKMFKGIETDKSYAEGSTTGNLPSGDIVALGRSLQAQGINVSENPAFGGVNPVHQGRGHYEGRAIDINGPPGMVEADDPVWGPKFDKIAAEARASGYNVLWRVPGHFNHMHIESSSTQMAETPQPPAQRVAAAEPQPKVPGQESTVLSQNIVPTPKAPPSATPETPVAPSGGSPNPRVAGGSPPRPSGSSQPVNNGVRTAADLLDSISMLKIMFAA